MQKNAVYSLLTAGLLLLHLPARGQHRQEDRWQEPPVTFATDSAHPAPLARPDQMPQYMGVLNTWISSHIRYPKLARRKNMQGRVLVKFIVDTTGKVTDPVVAQSSGYELLDAEALRVISEMPLWKPGMKDGRAVKVYFTLPVRFKLE